MRKLLFTLIFLLTVITVSAQFSPTGTKTRFVNGLALGTKLDGSLSAQVDSNAIWWRADSALMVKYKGASFRIGQAGSGGSVLYSDTSAMLANRLKISDTLTQLSGYVRKGFPVLYTDSASMLANRLKISDTSLMLINYPRYDGTRATGTWNIGITGNATTATALATGRTIAITGDLAYTSPSFDGSGNITAAGTLASIITAGGPIGSASVVPIITWDAKGRLTAVSTATIVAGSTSGILTLGTDLSGGSYNGSTNVTVNNASTLATVTGRGNSTSSGISLTENGNLAASYALYLKRNTDTGPLGYFIQAQNAAANANLFTVDVSGNIIGAGTIGASNFSGTSSGANTGDQTITLTGNVTGSGTGSFATTIAAGVVTTAMMASANISQWTNNSGYITGNQTITLSGDISGSGTTSITITIGAGKVTNSMLAGSIDYSKMNNGTVPTWNQNTSGNAATATSATTLVGMGAYWSGLATTMQYPVVYDNTNNRLGLGSQAQMQSFLGLGSNAYTSTAYLPLTGGTLSGNLVVSKSAALVNIDGSFSGNSGAALNLLGWSSSGYNWRVSTANYSTGLEFWISSIAGGSTFTGAPIITFSESGTITAAAFTGSWTGSAIGDSYISSASTWNAKQAALSGSGIVKSVGGTISYLTDNTSNWDAAYSGRFTTVSATNLTGSYSGNTLTISISGTQVNNALGYTAANNASLANYLLLTGGTVTGTTIYSKTGSSALIVGAGSNPGSYNAYFGLSVGISGAVTMGNVLDVSGATTTNGSSVSGDFGAGYSIGLVTGTSAKGINMGWNTSSDFGFIGAVHNGTAWKSLVLQPVAGGAYVGGTAAGNQIVTNSGTWAISTSGNAATATSATTLVGMGAYWSGLATTMQYPVVYDNTNNRLGLGSQAQMQSFLGLGSNAYTSTAYLPLTGGTLTGNLTGTSIIKSGGTSSQFLKADGSVDANDYLLTSSINQGTTNYVAKYAASLTIVNSQIFDNGTNVTINKGTPTANTRFQIRGTSAYSSNTNFTLSTEDVNGIVGLTIDDAGSISSKGVSAAYTAVTATYTILSYDYMIVATGGSNYTITLPTAVGIRGKIYVIKNNGATNPTLGTTSSQTIDGATTKSLATTYSTYMVQSDGANWNVITFF